jgi:nuclear transport factor 2 (NTF2) superfamily protein
MSELRPPLPAFTHDSAVEKVRLAEDAWNSCDPERVWRGYAMDSKELRAFTDDRIAVRFAYEWHDETGQWFRSYGNENWEFGADRRDPIASIFGGRARGAWPIPASRSWDFEADRAQLS